MSKQRRLGRGLEALLGRPLPNQENPESAHQYTNEHQEIDQDSAFQDSPQGEPATGDPPQQNSITDSATEPESLDRSPENPDPQQHTPQQTGDSHGETGLMWINVYDIDRNPYQPRQVFDKDDLQRLAESITQHGMLQPVILRADGDRYQLISGERRWRAATIAGWEKVPAQVWEADDRKMSEIAIVENVERSDLDPIEKAQSFQDYINKYECTQAELSQRIQIDRSTISNLIRLLELPEAVRNAIRSEEISPGHARALLPLGDDRKQTEFCQRIQEERLTVREVEDLVQETIREEDATSPFGIISADDEENETTNQAAGKPLSKNQHIQDLQQQLRLALGTKVDVRQGKSGRGKIVIHYKTNEEYERLHDFLCGEVGSISKSEVG